MEEDKFLKKKLFVMFLAMILMLAIPAAAFAEPDAPGTAPSAKVYRVINEVTNAEISQMQAASDANMVGEDCYQMTVTPNAGYDFPATVSLYDGGRRSRCRMPHSSSIIFTRPIPAF